MAGLLEHVSNSISLDAIRDYATGHLQTVFETMLAMKVTPLAESPVAALAGDHLAGMVGMAGEKVTGQAYLHLPTAFGAVVAAAMLGLPAEELGEAEVKDVLGEVTNMIAGGLKSWLCDAGANCALTTPAVIRGTAYRVMPKPGVETVLIGFGDQSNCGVLELHIKFN